MKVAQFIDAYYPRLDGVVTVVDNYANYLIKNGIDCAVVAPEANAEDDYNYKIFRFKSMESMSKLDYNIAMPIFDEAMHRKLIREKFDLVHAHTPFTLGSEAYRIAQRSKIPLVASFHSKYYDDILAITKSEIMAKWGTQYIVNFYNKCDFVWTVNHATADTLRSYGYTGPIEIVPNGVTISYPEDADSIRSALRKEYQISGDEAVFLFVGQQDWKKNIELIVKGLLKYRNAYGSFRMFMVGVGPAENDIKALVKTLGLEECFIFTGLVSDKTFLNALYLAADLFLFPSLYDNASLVVREASVMRLPSVLVSGANTAEGVLHKNNGFLCKNNIDSFCQCVQEAMSDRDLRKKVGLNASRTICQSWDEIIQAVEQRYVQAIEWKKANSTKKKRFIKNL